MSCYIGEFHMVHYKKVLNNFAYHRIILCLVGKHECKHLIRQYVFADNNSVMSESDY